MGQIFSETSPSCDILVLKGAIPVERWPSFMIESQYGIEGVTEKRLLSGDSMAEFEVIRHGASP